MPRSRRCVIGQMAAIVGGLAVTLADWCYRVPLLDAATPAPIPQPRSSIAPPLSVGSPPPPPPRSPPQPLPPTATPLPVYNVRKFGAVGDGRTDDTAAIQAAIDAVPPVGGTVFFPPGTYIVAPKPTVGIVIRSNLRLVGAGAASVLKIRDHLGNWQRLLSPRSLGGMVENFTVEDLAFDGNILNNPESLIDNTVGATYQTFIYITAGGNINVRRCRFAPCAGVWAVSLNGETIRDCSVEDCYFRFAMREGNPDYDNAMIYIDGTQFVLSGNRFETTITPGRGGRACMEAHSGPAQVFGNTSVGFQTGLNITGAFAAGAHSGDITCHDNTITDALQAILIWPNAPSGLTNVTVANNTIAIAQTKHGMVDTCGIEVLFSPEAPLPIAGLTITKNTIRFEDEGAGRSGFIYYNSSGIGLHNLGGVAGCVIEDNTIELAPSSGILIGNGEPGQRVFRGVRIARNIISNPGQNIGFPAEFRAGILVNSTATDIAILGNTIADTFAKTRCPAAIAFDTSPGNSYIGIQVADNRVVSANGTLPVILPS